MANTSAELTISESMTSNCAGKWYLSMRPASPKQTLSVRFENGKTFKYLGTGKVNVGDPVIIDYGGATSYCFGEVSGIENGITVKRTRALKPLFTFTTEPGKTEIKKNVQAISGIDDIDDAASYFGETVGDENADKFRPVDHLVAGVLNAITVIAYPQLAGEDAVLKAKNFLKQKKTVPAFMFGEDFTYRYFGEVYDTFRLAECAEVALTGFYPGWKDTLSSFNFQALSKLDSKLKYVWNGNQDAFYIYFNYGSDKLEKYIEGSHDFAEMTNELVFRSALSILIRGGFSNLLAAALTTEMPIKPFFDRLVELSDGIGSAECSRILKESNYKDRTFAVSDSDTAQEEKTAKIKEKGFNISDATLTKYSGRSKHVEIPDGVKIVGRGVFSDAKKVEEISFPDSVTQLKPYACRGAGLKKVNISRNITSIGDGCFRGCEALTSINLKQTKIKTLNKEIFYGCRNLEEVLLPDTLKKIQVFAFMFSGIKSITIPKSVEVIELWGIGSVCYFDESLKCYLTDIFFEGTEEIALDDLKRPKKTITVHCKKDSNLWNEFIRINEDIEVHNKEQEERFKKTGYYSQPRYEPYIIEEL